MFKSRYFGVLRSVLVGIAVFVLAAIAGMLLAEAMPAGRELSTRSAPTTGSVAAFADRRSAATSRTSDERAFARSMVYSGATGLAVSVAGLVMVGRRRRLW